MLPRIESLSNSFKSMPSIVIVPEFGSYNLQSRLNMVDFPEPLFPTKDTVSFALIEKLIPFKIGSLSS